jgi:pyruvate dehydrogenase E2 component (dihydrolipoamide acetyltransferase)
MPKAGMSMESGTILKWLKKVGETVSVGEPILEIETDKVSMEIEAEVSGTLLQIVRQEGEEVPVTATIGYIGRAGEEIAEGKQPASGTADRETIVASRETETGSSTAGSRLGTNRRGAATPLARTLAKEHGVDISSVEPSGARGEIKGHDVLTTVFKHRVKASPARSPMSTVRRTIARRMAESHATIPPVTLNAEADVTRLLHLKEKLQTQTGSRYSLNDFILKAAVDALREHPGIMSQMDGNELIQLAAVNLGIAVSVDDVLLVPVIRNAESLSLTALAKRAHELIEKARDRGLSPDDVVGATFTVTNLGMYGIIDFTPVINPPESAILGVGAVRNCLQLIDEKIENRSKIYLSLTIDHRIIDGVAGAKFLVSLCESLELPLRLVA